MEVTASKKAHEKAMEKMFRILAEGMICWAAAAGLLLAFCAVLNLSCTTAVLLVSAAAGVLLCSCVANFRYGIVLAVIVMGSSAAVLLLSAGESVLNGMLQVFNEAADTVGRSTPFLPEKYRLLFEETALQDGDVFAGVFAVLTGCFCYVLLKRKKNWRKLNNSGTVIVFSSIYMVLLLAVGSVIAGRIVPQEDYVEPAVLEQIRDYAEARADALRYKKETVNTLPKGRLDTAHIWEAEEIAALEVTMSEPQSLYLRGYVGSEYEDNKWKDISRDIYYENKELFYWMEQWKASPDRQLASLRGSQTGSKTLADTELASEELSVQVENINADSQYLYTPYELISLDAEVLGNCGNSYQMSGGLAGTRQYSFTTYGNLVKDFPQMAALGYLYGRENQSAEYTQAESYYNAFVYDNYTDIPVKLQRLFQQELGYAGETEAGHVDYRSAITKIREYLEENIVYGNYGEELPQEEDFLEFFLTDAQIGHSVHYATAAAMMFRYYGIPSRYVEGYLITPEDAESADADGRITVPGSNGHAWTEIYVDGLGWVPVEMTPEYYGRMEEPDLTKGLQPDATVVLREPEEKVEEQELQEPDNLKQKLNGFFLNMGKILLAALLIFDAGCVFLFLYVLIRRICANGKRRKAFSQKDHRKAICSMTGYMTGLMDVEQGMFSEEAKSEYRRAYAIGQKAAFSNHEMTQEERDTVNSCRKYLLKCLKKEEGWYRKWVLKYVERLY